MPSTLSVDHFLRGLELSGILSNDDVSAILRIVDIDEASYPTPESVADYLLSAGMLTRWQADKLLDGKHKGFLLGNYVLKDMLGQGAMGTVYLAEQTLMKRRCAVKLLHPTRLKDPELLERFLREGRAVATTDHPNIIRAYELSRVREGNTDLYFLAMELATGRNLQAVVEEDGTFDSRPVGQILRQVALGLAHAHTKGLIHRDIKPTNLMLDEKGFVKILDLGLARFFDDSDDSRLSSLHDSTFLGTAGYLAPEQAYNSRDVDARADLYSLGATAFFLLCGRAPFNEGTVVRRLIESQSQQPPRPRDIRNDVDDELDGIVVKLLQPVAADRFQSSDELIEALNDWLQDAPATVDTDPPGEGSWRGRAARVEPVSPGVGTLRMSSDATTVTGSSDVRLFEASSALPVAVLIPSDSQVTRDPALRAAVNLDDFQRGRRVRFLVGGTLLAALFGVLAYSLWRLMPPTRLESSDRQGVVGPPIAGLDGDLSSGTRSQSSDNSVAHRGHGVESGLSGPGNVVLPGPDKPDRQTNVALPQTPFDQLTATFTSTYEQQVADDDAGGDLEGLMAVFGDSRLNHWGRVLRVAFGEQERVVASLGNDHSVRVWDLDSGNSRLLIALPLTATPESLAYVLEGSCLLVGFADGMVASYAAVDGRSSWTRKVGDGGVIDLAAVHRGESVWVAAAQSKQLQLLNAATGEPVKTLALAHQPRRLRVNADETLVAVALETGAIDVFDCQSGELRVRIPGHQQPASALDFSPDQKQLASACASERAIAIWNLDTPSEPQRFTIKDEPHAIAYTPKSQQLLIGNGWSLQVMDLKRPDSPKPLYAHFGMVRDIAVSTKHKAVASVSDDHQVALWQLPGLQRAFASESANQSLKDLSVSQDGRFLAVADYWHARLWDVAATKLVHQLGPYSSVMEHVAVSPDGRQVVGASIFEVELRFWSTETGRELARVPLPGGVTGLAYQPDSKQLACTYRARVSDGISGVTVIDAESLQVLDDRPLAKEWGSCSQPVWSRDGQRLLVCEERSVALWEMASGQLWKRLKMDSLKAPRLRASVLNHRGTRAFVGTFDGRVMECDFEADQVREFFRHEHGVWTDSLALSPDGASLLIATKDGQLQMRSLDADGTQRTRATRIGPPRGGVEHAVFSHDGRFVITGNGNGTVYVLKTSELNWR